MTLGDLTQGPVLLATFGLIVTLVLVARGLRGGIIIGIFLGQGSPKEDAPA